MRFDCEKGKRRREARKAAQYEWHPKFLWWPKKIDGFCYWLETVERRLVDGYYWDYWAHRPRKIPQQETEYRTKNR